MTSSLLLLALVSAAAGLAVARSRPSARLAATLWRGIYWFSLPLSPLVLASAPIRQTGPAVLVAIVGLLVVLPIAAGYARRVFSDARERAAFTLSVYWPNTGWLGLPVAVGLFGTAALPVAMLYNAVVSGPQQFVVGGTVAASAHDGGNGGALRAFLRNHYLVPTVLGLGWALYGPPLPGPVTTVASDLTLATTVPAFFALGLTLVGVSVRPDRHVWMAVALRLGVAPLFLLAATPVVHVPREFFVQSGMATGLTSLAMAGEHRLPIARIAPAIAWSTAIVGVAAGAWIGLH